MSHVVPDALAAAVQDRRRTMGMSVVALARRAGIDEADVRLVENGDVAPESFVRRICAAVDIRTEVHLPGAPYGVVLAVEPEDADHGRRIASLAAASEGAGWVLTPDVGAFLAARGWSRAAQGRSIGRDERATAAIAAATFRRWAVMGAALGLDMADAVREWSGLGPWWHGASALAVVAATMILDGLHGQAPEREHEDMLLLRAVADTMRDEAWSVDPGGVTALRFVGGKVRVWRTEAAEIESWTIQRHPGDRMTVRLDTRRALVEMRWLPWSRDVVDAISAWGPPEPSDGGHRRTDEGRPARPCGCSQVGMLHVGGDPDSGATDRDPVADRR